MLQNVPSLMMPQTLVMMPQILQLIECLEIQNTEYLENGA